jgi:predicted lipoprotein with Yx(FWY)xxD motif
VHVSHTGLSRGWLQAMRGLLLLAVAVLVTGGCGGQDGAPAGGSSATAPPSATPSPSPGSPSTPAPTQGSTPSAQPGKPPSTGRVVKTADSQYGTMLFDRSGQAIYLFDKETSSRPRCYAACARAWPPVLTRDLPRAAGEVRESLLGTTRRRDGTRQVTYNGHPLYFYAHEGENEVLCHGVAEFGGLWLVLTPDGRPAPA